MSAFDLWTPEFCLGCDKQTDGTAYCSESCRLADFEKTSSPSSVASSPGLNAPSYPWTSPRQQPSNKLYLAPAYDFTNAQPYGSTPLRQSYLSAPRTSSTRRTLATSSSNTSLCSMQSTTSSNSDASQLSEKARRELQAYAVSFEQVRLQRRRSY
ncbi:uncharacterized protein CTRU02_203532 [Colletotrichum truncatum]|uniref:Uncharacterized protein n=1 Tax=Colletotrichum truncatum TaxID=5467 RepID=A0ACC3Z9I3_COLTU|nr:uncharacterized protein CTRU02_05917 [Colletotrichum truncatum]KAF6793662.1 hypothetical protein CTRU02_05917 [Colletotrichum truncatum]